MDAIEVARRRAASIHAQALLEGADPWSPLDFVLREVEREGYAAEAVEPGSVQLEGALAMFMPEIGLILYGDSGTPFERALLVAHELGHALLGDALGNCEVEIDRPVEGAADGEGRVIAHGPRQRREIQMDLFARELVLPRPFVRRLHLDEAMSAAQITDRMGAEHSIVAQQLLDALLVPEIPEREPRPRRKLTRAQQDASEHFGKAYLLEAGPGTGKTETLVHRVAWLLANKPVLPREILVLTYSNKAAAELSERIAGNDADALAAMWIGTFHAFGRDLLHIFGDKVGRTRNPTFLDRVGAIDLLEHELPTLGLRQIGDRYDPTALLDDVLDAISRAQDEVCDAARYHELATAEYAQAQSAAAAEPEAGAATLHAAEAKLDIAAIYTRYEALKSKNALVDFGDYVMLAVRLLENHEPAKAYARAFLHVLVDEYQDVNQASVRLLKAICPDGTGLWAVGDPRQSIYRFRGASSRNVARFGKDFPGAKGSELVLNHRSRREIVDLLSHFGQGMVRVQGEGDPPLRAYEKLGPFKGPCGIKPDLISFPDTSKEAPAIAQIIDQSVKAGEQYRDHCVLVSGNDRLAKIAAQLEAMGLPVLYFGSLFERAEIKDLLALLSLRADRWASGLLRTACMPEFPMTLDDVAKALRQIRDAENGPIEWISAPEQVAAALSSEGGASLRALARMLSSVDAYAHPSTILAQLLLDHSRIAARMAGRTDASGAAAALAVWQFINFVRGQRNDAGNSIIRLLARVRRLLLLKEDRELRQLPAAAQAIDAVRLMTIHGAKGLEFPTVHLPGLNERTLPKPEALPRFLPPVGMVAYPRGTVEAELRASHLEEQDCLFYVALSRAEEKLHLYRAKTTTNNVDRPISSFIARLGDQIDLLDLVPQKALPALPSDLPVTISFPHNWRIDAWTLDIYGKCPRRFLYTHLLRTGGGLHKTALRLAHDAVRAICIALAKSDALPDVAEIRVQVAAACTIPELAEHGNAAGFQQLVLDLVLRYCATRDGASLQATELIETSVGTDTVLAQAHEVLTDSQGTILRLVQSGHHRDDNVDAIATRALVVHAAARAGMRVELLHLADMDPPLALSLKKGEVKRFDTKLNTVLSKIRSGHFPAAPRPERCARCAAFLVCDALPPGALDCTIGAA